MSVTIVNDYYFKPDGDVAEGKAAAKDLVGYFTDEFPEIQLSLWLEAQENPLHHYHITVFRGADVIERVRDSEGIKRFVDRLYPHIDQGTFISPLCDAWLVGGTDTDSISAQS